MLDWENALANTPDISFIDNRGVDDIRSEMVADYEAYISAATGETVTLDRSSPHRMELYAAADQIYQAMQYIDRAGKQNLLKYSYGGFLDNLGLFKGTTRNQATAASTTIRFTLSAERPSVVSIPKGTRVAMEGVIYFATDEYAEIPIGGMTVDVPATCTVAGEGGNGYEIGDLSTIVDPVPYVASASNITPTSGGANIESDESYKERIYLAPGAYSTAGPEDSYIYHAKSYSPAVGDVEVTSDQAAGTVDVVFLMTDGSKPNEDAIDGMLDYLSARNLRPMTDLVRVAAPDEVPYTIALTYYINHSDSARAVSIQQSVTVAVSEYVSWQRTIGRDINPDELRARIMAAGAKRIVVTAPTYTVVPGTKVGVLQGDPSVSYGGLEDD